jgi:hypothetical protein
MGKKIKVGIAVIAILIVAMVSIPVYFALTSPKVDVTGLQVISINPGLTANISSSDRFINIGQNLTALVYLSPGWPVIVKNFSVATPGFSIVSLNVSLPLLVDQNVTLSLVLTSNQSYSGSVLFFIGSINASNLTEKILVPDVVVDTSSKTVTLVSVFNTGDVPLTNSTAYLIRSDGLLVNSTTLPTEGQLPGKISFHNIDMSYSNATVIEIYHVNVTTATGASATSRAIWLTCNCK